LISPVWPCRNDVQKNFGILRSDNFIGWHGSRYSKDWLQHIMTSFYEIKNCRQRPDEPRRRWFSTRRQDLIVWFGDAERIVGFRYAYDATDGAFAVTWTTENGCRHDRLDAGHQPGRPMAPLLQPTRQTPGRDVLLDFRRSCGRLESTLADFVAKKAGFLHAVSPGSARIPPPDCR
jgi:hypothetical protein